MGIGATTAAELSSGGGGGAVFSSYGTLGAFFFCICCIFAGALQLGFDLQDFDVLHFDFDLQHLTRIGLAQDFAVLWQVFSLLSQLNNPASADPVGNRNSATGSKITQPDFMASPKKNKMWKLCPTQGQNPSSNR